MSLIVKQISSMHKIRNVDDISVKEINKKSLLKGQKFSYQISAVSEKNCSFKVNVNSSISDFVKLYVVKNIAMDHPVSADTKKDDDNNDFITKTAGFMPDMLLPLEEQNDFISLCGTPATLWVEVCIPADIAPGIYEVCVELSGGDVYADMNEYICKKMEIEVINAVIPESRIAYTQWFHTDCIANFHRVELYSEKHWELIDKYMALASYLGINMILTPVLTPSLDIAEGMYREKTQLTNIEKQGDKYIFDFTKLKRWISLCRKNGIKYLEMAHLFSQWGLKYTPNIVISENGKESYMFGWHTGARDTRYKEFLGQFLPALMKVLDEESFTDNTYFHISDEPSEKSLEAYHYAYSVVRPLIGNCKIMDAVSEYEFHKNKLMDIPVALNSSVHEFINNNVEELYTYYCCVPDKKESNRFMSMPSYRNRIIGLQMYKYDIKGFLHWGYNFYNSQFSKYMINPYVTSSADSGFPSGDSFSVYPYKDTALPSLRGIVFRDALEDIELCRLLESYIGKEEVIRLIENEADMELTFSEYPRNSDYIPDVIEKITERLKEFI